MLFVYHTLGQLCLKYHFLVALSHNIAHNVVSAVAFRDDVAQSVVTMLR